MLKAPDESGLSPHLNPLPLGEEIKDQTMAESTRKVFKESEMSFKLPEHMHKEFEERLERVKAMEKEAGDKLQALMEKEKELEEFRVRLDRENAEARQEIQKKLDSLQERYDQEKALMIAESDRLKIELETAQKESEALREERKRVLNEYEVRRNELEKVFFQRESSFKERFDELSNALKLSHNDETKFAKLKTQEYQRLKTKERQLKEKADQLLKQERELLAKTKAFEANKKKFKARVEKEYQDKTKELQEDFNRRSEYHRRRLEDEEKEKDWVLSEKQKIQTREQSLTLEIKIKQDEHFRKQQADLDSREKDLAEKEKLLLKEEQTLIEEKEKVLKNLSLPRNAKTVVEEMKALVEEQHKVVTHRKKFLKIANEEQTKRKVQMDEAVKMYEKEKNTITARWKDEIKAFQEEIKRLREKEQTLADRETRELTRLNDEYEQFRISLEVGQIEKEEGFDKMRDKVREEENLLRDKQAKWLEKEKEELKRIEGIEEESLNHLNAIFKSRDELMKSHEEIGEFIRHFHSAYRQHLDQQSAEYDAFKKNIEALKSEAERLTRNLEAKEKVVREESAATLQIFGERLQQREDMVDNMEKDLKSRLQEYRSFVSELQQVKGELIKQEQGRKVEFMESLGHYENRLTGLAKAFEDLSNEFHREKERGIVEVDRETIQPVSPLEYSDDLAKMEWIGAVKNRLNPAKDYKPASTDLIYKLGEKYDQWIKIPSGRFLMGNKHSRDAAPLHQETIESPFLMKKYPVTNIEFYKFVHETDYRTEAESGIVPIVYHNGQTRQSTDPSGRHSRTSYEHPTLAPEADAFWLRANGIADALDEKFNHPVTQVTWNDAMAYCSWKSETSGRKYRLPTESEWEYVASCFGRLRVDEFHWSADETPKFCNIEEAGIGDTTPVDFFPETDATGGVQDMFGNVYEWTLDSQRQTAKSPANKLTYKLARGGSFITPFKHIAHWRHIAFAINYCTSFLGFRVVCVEK